VHSHDITEVICMLIGYGLGMQWRP